MRKILNSRLSERRVFEKCLEILAIDGAVLLLPTDTVYGLVCRWDDADGIAKIRKMKGRDADKPFQMLAPDVAAVERAGVAVSERIRRLTEAVQPGTLTIVAKTIDGEATIGFRIPDDQFLTRLMRASGANLAATSANPAGEPPMTSVADAATLFEPPPDLVVDGGVLSGTASTVVDATGEAISIIRSGAAPDAEVLKAADGEP